MMSNAIVEDTTIALGSDTPSTGAFQMLLRLPASIVGLGMCVHAPVATANIQTDTTYALSIVASKNLSSDYPGQARSDGPIYAKLRTQIEELRNLSLGWDTYDAEPPSLEARDITLEILDVLQDLHMKVIYITPTSEGSILLKHQFKKNSVTWEIDSDGEIGVMIERSDTGPEFRSISTNQIGAFITELA